MEPPSSRHWKNIYQPDRDPGLPELAPLREAVSADDDFAADVAAENAFDASMRSRLATCPVPDDLAARLVAAMEASRAPAPTPFPTPRGNWIHPMLLGFSAAAMLFLIIGFTFFSKPGAPTDFQSLSPEAQHLIAAIEAQSDQTTERVLERDYATLVAYLRDHAVPSPANLPGTISPSDGIACQSFNIDGVGTGLVCFRKGDDVYHLFTLKREDMPCLGNLKRPVFTRIDDHSCAIWADGDQIYVLTSKAEEKKVRQVLSI